jgi:hypothetical protein
MDGGYRRMVDQELRHRHRVGLLTLEAWKQRPQTA